jgi:hypothetical protein
MSGPIPDGRVQPGDGQSTAGVDLAGDFLVIEAGLRP